MYNAYTEYNTSHEMQCSKSVQVLLTGQYELYNVIHAQTRVDDCCSSQLNLLASLISSGFKNFCSQQWKPPVLVKKGDTTEANIPRRFKLLWDRDM